MSTLQEAIEILGNTRVFGPTEWNRIFGDKINLRNVKPEIINNIPWSNETLKKPGLNQSHFLFLGIKEFGGEPLNILSWYKVFRGSNHPRFFGQGESWFEKEAFAKVPCDLRWYLMTKSVASGSLDQDYYRQLDMLPNEYDVPTATERVTGNILYYLVNNSYLDDFTARVRDIDSSKTNVFVNPDPKGIMLGDQYTGSKKTFGIAASLSINAENGHAIGSAVEIADRNGLELCLATLKDKDWYVRWRAVRVLGKTGDGHVAEALCALFEDPVEHVSRGVTTTLVRIGAPAVEPLCGVLKQANEGIRKGIVNVLGLIGDGRAVEPLIAALKDTNKDIRRIAATSLGMIGDGRVVEPLCSALKDTDEKVRDAAVGSLGKAADVRAVEPLALALKDADSIVRMSAATALGNIHDGRAVEPLGEALKDTNKYVRKTVAEALVKIGAPSVGLFCDALKDANPDIRRNAANFLGNFSDKLAVESLCAALKDTDSETRRFAAASLGKIGDGRAMEPLCAALKDTEGLVRSRAASALGDIRDGHAVESLCAVLKDTAGYVRSSAANALGKIGDRRAAGPLHALVDDPDKDVREAVIEALDKIGDGRTM